MRKWSVSIVFCSNDKYSLTFEVHSSVTKKARETCFFVRKLVLYCAQNNQRVGVGHTTGWQAGPGTRTIQQAGKLDQVQGPYNRLASLARYKGHTTGW